MRKLLMALALLIPTPVVAQSLSHTVRTPAVAGALIVKAGTVYLAGLNVTSGASAGYVMLFDAADVPADGAVAPLRCLPIAANTGLDVNWRGAPVYLQQGAVVVFSTTGCFTKTASATAFIAGDIQ